MLLIYTAKTFCHDVVTIPLITFVIDIKKNIQGGNAKWNGQNYLPV